MNFRPMVARESPPGVHCMFYVYVRVPHILNDVTLAVPLFCIGPTSMYVVALANCL